MRVVVDDSLYFRPDFIDLAVDEALAHRLPAAGVPEVWIEDLQHDLLLVYRDPQGRSYTSSRTLKRDESIATLAIPDITFKVLDLIG